MSKRKTTEEFIVDAIKVHQDKCGYSKVEYINSNTKVCIICPEHGEFWQTPNNHLSGKGCIKCGRVNQIMQETSNTEEFVSKALKVHNEKYDYTKVNYIDTKTKVCIICPIHGEFYQTPNVHLSGCGCRKCSYEIRAKNKADTVDEFVEKANIIHNNLYDYSNVEYINAHTKIDVICKNHGTFYVTPNNHLNGKGCPLCKSSKAEIHIRQVLSKNNILFEEQKKFEWLGEQSLDFYLTDYNIGIECQGIQHFKPIKHFGGNVGYIDRIKRDKRKEHLCKENGLKLLYYSNFNYKFPYKVYIDEKELLNEILKM